jgi:hypothetical protein
MTDLWLDEDGAYRVIAPDAQSAAKTLRDHLIKRGEIGKWTPVTVEFVKSTSTRENNLYREI